MKIDFEEYLIDKHAEQYEGLDDDMPDNYSEWLCELDVDVVIRWANEWAKGLIEG